MALCPVDDIVFFTALDDLLGVDVWGFDVDRCVLSGSELRLVFGVGEL